MYCFTTEMSFLTLVFLLLLFHFPPQGFHNSLLLFLLLCIVTGQLAGNVVLRKLLSKGIFCKDRWQKPLDTSDNS